MEMKQQDGAMESSWTEEFENLYITTYQALYRHGSLIFNQKEKVKELLILTYAEAYQRDEQLQKEKSPLEWLLKRMDFLAETKLEATKEMLEASYAEEKMQSKEAKKEVRSSLDEATILLEIEDRLGIMDKPAQPEQKEEPQPAAKSILSVILVVLALAAIIIGIGKLKHQVDLLREPFQKRFVEPSEDESSQQANRVQVGDKVVYLSDVGQVLYSLPLDETDLAGADENNPEIQVKDGWTYYLPCPERKNSQLSQVWPELFHTLYRMKNGSGRIEIIAQEVDNYQLGEDAVYISQYDRVQRVDMDEKFESMKPGYYAVEKDEEIYIYDMLGRTIKTEANGNIHYGDRIFEMSSNRIVEVRPDVRTKGKTTYYLKETEEGKAAIYCSVNGKETLFEEKGRSIDCFCIAGDSLYYSAFMRRGKSGAQYSEIFCRSLTDQEKKSESLRDEFSGRISQMYYSEETGQIYGSYFPKSWKNHHGVIAVISQSGQMSYINDEMLRADQETSGNDFLEFVLIQNGDVYCYWKDCYWEPDENPIVKWRKVLVIPDHNRIMVK
ncbi:MAG: hypothetical protein Q4C73_07210 [Eubacteriales bacterium]|nr:hypothetical protein [Eubacteriales bacterium]